MEARTVCNTARQTTLFFTTEGASSETCTEPYGNYRKYMSIRNIDHNSYVPYLQISHNLICLVDALWLIFLSSDHLLNSFMAQALWTTVLFYNYCVDKKIILKSLIWKCATCHCQLEILFNPQSFSNKYKNWLNLFVYVYLISSVQWKWKF
jgi:hypothetical protein